MDVSGIAALRNHVILEQMRRCIAQTEFMCAEEHDLAARCLRINEIIALTLLNIEQASEEFNFNFTTEFMAYLTKHLHRANPRLPSETIDDIKESRAVAAIDAIEGGDPLKAICCLMGFDDDTEPVYPIRLENNKLRLSGDTAHAGR